jgi:hypothetical protein
MQIKRYRQENNAFLEDENGICLGMEKTDQNGNVTRSIQPNFPAFSQELETVHVTYLVFTKPFGRDNFLLEKTVIKTINGAKFYGSNPSLPNFGKLCQEEEEGAMKDIAFFAKVFYGELPTLNTKMFIGETLNYLLTN